MDFVGLGVTVCPMFRVLSAVALPSSTGLLLCGLVMSKACVFACDSAIDQAKNWTRRVCGTGPTGTTVQAPVYTLGKFNATRQSGGFVKQIRTLVKGLPASIPEALKTKKPAIFGSDSKLFDDPAAMGLNSMLKSALDWGWKET